ncbi:tRNA N(3)-methylcytidine methyltransferase METTL6 [Schistocerca americana]|uniref:tRNA N(3)-methylcytidine methyltransferase METTL6 n=1 Tax=Schistocerca americana TaxID=7009 RepID=UPI001F4F76F8|nr:tRNA N(3)-methylcytidine methyltransferase METTL6 [Schistocerca americana]XP_046992630.1 tRNA N(3)-methylcytidine methyltransferase METTL6 [Schistocerca americana]XP_046992631.1 tRNA N(3)-methylcytidine methyltransferase METTL6 [Schistocerca americana]XP_046992632.1 tRNA N(3)-methylcytidine methyltransferase METTL6 [Schistocerca americana]XP_046992634.1 tRNA N(3)-methylcytidine methyltransferase METTL6 [Schistocerca americana]XP_046992635.1 tRNA N(3)-methylcytidine methyltransferase METTL6 
MIGMDAHVEERDERSVERTLTADERSKLENQNSRLVPQFLATKLELEAKKNWDLFYKRNDTRFFKDRHWTVREFSELSECSASEKSKVLLEVGCGVGNFVYPLIEEKLNLFIYACDFSPRAIEYVKSHSLYDETKIKAFQVDITTDEIFHYLQCGSVDIVTLVFVLSAIHPHKFLQTLRTLFKLLKPGGIMLFRDYGLYDMAQLRFKPGNKIAENFYMRQDGTRSYYFSVEEVHQLVKDAGFQVTTNSYIHRRTVNKKEEIDVPRIFIQGKFRKVPP